MSFLTDNKSCSNGGTATSTGQWAFCYRQCGNMATDAVKGGDAPLSVAVAGHAGTGTLPGSASPREGELGSRRCNGYISGSTGDTVAIAVICRAVAAAGMTISTNHALTDNMFVMAAGKIREYCAVRSTVSCGCAVAIPAG